MGYYTYYRLEVYGKSNVYDIIHELRKWSEGANYAFDADGDTLENCKWYDYNEEMVEFSKKYPEVLFVIFGEGEESSNIWRTFYLNGKYEKQPAKIVYNNPPEWVTNYEFREK